MAFIDIKLPDIDGLALMDEINKSFHHMPCFIISGYFLSQEELNKLKERAGGKPVGIIPKPFQGKQIEEAIRQCQLSWSRSGRL
ncbi:MAG: response regulator [Gemmataceae bacterium]|nr:response regulator [Gemmataceae bacterium]